MINSLIEVSEWGNSSLPTYENADRAHLPRADICDALPEGPLVDEAELEGVTADLHDVVDEGAECGERVGR